MRMGRGQQGYCSPLTMCKFRFKPAGNYQTWPRSDAFWTYLAAKRPHPLWLWDLGERLSTPAAAGPGGARPPKRFLECSFAWPRNSNTLCALSACTVRLCSQLSEMKVSISKYRYRYRYFFGSLSVSVSTILLKLVSISNIGDTFEKYR